MGILDGPAVVDILGEVEGELSLDLDAAIVGWWVEDRAGFSTDDAIFGRRAESDDAMDLIYLDGDYRLYKYVQLKEKNVW